MNSPLPVFCWLYTVVPSMVRALNSGMASGCASRCTQISGVSRPTSSSDVASWSSNTAITASCSAVDPRRTSSRTLRPTHAAPPVTAPLASATADPAAISPTTSVRLTAVDSNGIQSGAPTYCRERERETTFAVVAVTCGGFLPYCGARCVFGGDQPCRHRRPGRAAGPLGIGAGAWVHRSTWWAMCEGQPWCSSLPSGPSRGTLRDGQRGLSAGSRGARRAWSSRWGRARPAPRRRQFSPDSPQGPELDTGACLL